MHEAGRVRLCELRQQLNYLISFHEHTYIFSILLVKQAYLFKLNGFLKLTGYIGAFKTLSNIYGRAFLREKITCKGCWLFLQTYFSKYAFSLRFKYCSSNSNMAR